MTAPTITLAPASTATDMRFRVTMTRDICPCGSRSATTRGASLHCDHCGSAVSIAPSVLQRARVTAR